MTYAKNSTITAIHRPITNGMYNDTYTVIYSNGIRRNYTIKGAMNKKHFEFIQSATVESRYSKHTGKHTSDVFTVPVEPQEEPATEEPTTEEPTTEEPAQEAQTMKKHFFYLADIDTTFTVTPMTKKEIISIGQELKELYEFMSDDQTISGYTKDGRFFYYDNSNFDSFKKSDIINAVSVIYSDESGDYYWGGFDISEWGIANPTEDGTIIIADHDNIREVDREDYHEDQTSEEPEEAEEEKQKEEKPAENETNSAFIAEMVESLKYFKRVLWSYIDGTRYERDISGDFWGAHECGVILRFVNDRLKAQGAEPYYKLTNDFDSLTECFEEIMQKFEYGDERTIEEIISEYNFS